MRDGGGEGILRLFVMFILMGWIDKIYFIKKKTEKKERND
jgi:hypothetical protein